MMNNLSASNPYAVEMTTQPFLTISASTSSSASASVLVSTSLNEPPSHAPHSIPVLQLQELVSSVQLMTTQALQDTVTYAQEVAATVQGEFNQAVAAGAFLLDNVNQSVQSGIATVQEGILASAMTLTDGLSQVHAAMNHAGAALIDGLPVSPPTALAMGTGAAALGLGTIAAAKWQRNRKRLATDAGLSEAPLKAARGSSALNGSRNDQPSTVEDEAPLDGNVGDKASQAEPHEKQAGADPPSLEDDLSHTAPEQAVECEAPENELGVNQEGDKDVRNDVITDDMDSEAKVQPSISQSVDKILTHVHPA